MIQDDYCSEELCKLMLEKELPLSEVYIKRDSRPIYYTLPSNHPDWQECKAYYIPTLYQVMKFFREECDIHIVIEPYSYDVTKEKTSSYKFSIWFDDNCEEYYDTFNSYFEAFEKAIKIILQTIKPKTT